VTHPPAPARERLGIQAKDFADVRQVNRVTADDARNRADFLAHSPALVARKIADRRIGQPAIARNRRHRGQDPDR
jgi:hypothetical protein